MTSFGDPQHQESADTVNKAFHDNDDEDDEGLSGIQS